MKSVKEIISESEKKIAKAIDTSDINGPTPGTANAITPRQELDGVILSIANRMTPFRDRVTRKAGVGSAFTFNLRSSLFASGESADPRKAVYGDGALPQAKSSKYYTKTSAYKAIGYSGSVTGLAQAQGAALVNLYADEIEATTRRVIQAEEWLDFWGDNSYTDPTTGEASYDGLDALITTNVIDASGAAISKSLIDQACNLIGQQGGSATHIFTSFRVSDQISNLYDSSMSVTVVNGESRDNLIYGNRVKRILTSIGELEIVPDFFINAGNTYPLSNGATSTPSGAATSTIFVLAMPYIEMIDLQSLGMEELGRTADKREFYVNEYTALKLKAEPWCAKITNVKDTL